MPPSLKLEEICDKLGLTWQELPFRFKEEIGHPWEVVRSKARDEITRERLLEKMDEKASHDRTLKIARFLLEYFKRLVKSILYVEVASFT
jgi:predicted transcriptional regulator